MESPAQTIVIVLFTALVGSALAWVVGAQVSYFWDDRRRKRDSDLTAMSSFYKLYGEFFATWKLWSSYKRYGDRVPTPEYMQWTLLERASAVEGGFEALFVKLASERDLSDEDQQ